MSRPVVLKTFSGSFGDIRHVVINVKTQRKKLLLSIAADYSQITCEIPPNCDDETFSKLLSEGHDVLKDDIQEAAIEKLYILNCKSF